MTQLPPCVRKAEVKSHEDLLAWLKIQATEEQMEEDPQRASSASSCPDRRQSQRTTTPTLKLQI